MAKITRIKIDVRDADADHVRLSVVVERPMQKDGTIYIGGTWAKPERMPDGSYYMSFTLPKVTSLKTSQQNQAAYNWFRSEAV